MRQLQIQVQPDRLLAYDLSLSDVLAAARVSTGVRGAGFIETAQPAHHHSDRRPVAHAGQRWEKSSWPVRPTARACASKTWRVWWKARSRSSATRLIQGEPGVLLTMSSQYGANTMEVTTALEAALAELKPVFAKEGITLYRRLHRPATFIEVALKNIKHSLHLGAVLVAVVLFLFLGHFRTAFISLTAIPLSLLAAIIVLDKFGVTLNTITLGGLAIAIGEVVDDAIIDVENIFRRLRENQLLAQPRPVFNVVLGGLARSPHGCRLCNLHCGSGVSARADADRTAREVFLAARFELHPRHHGFAGSGADLDAGARPLVLRERSAERKRTALADAAQGRLPARAGRRRAFARSRHHGSPRWSWQQR